ncbi:4Fe-4S binding protein [Anaerobacillus sp. CMMVII]|uniref:4Fe-4S binding protein n=1 Tax=Anaerobacillus sp. CMMVII TaxID=2755588 RepID=UPI0021C4F030|nr:4Fe-4S binding protein [Anaerobacillus sp. CMMVII]
MLQKWLANPFGNSTSIQLVESYCLNFINEEINCSHCRNVCPTNAIIFKNDKIELDHTKCNKCSVCVHHCPTDALFLETETLYHYENRSHLENMFV